MYAIDFDIIPAGMSLHTMTFMSAFAYLILARQNLPGHSLVFYAIVSSASAVTCDFDQFKRRYHLRKLRETPVARFFSRCVLL